jgi:transposase
MDFPLVDLLNQQACYDYLLQVLHPHGVTCPRCQHQDGLDVHRRHRAPVLDYQCNHCGCVFNAWTNTPLANTHRKPAELILILRGILQGVPTARLAREMKCDRKHLLELRRKLQGLVEQFQKQDPALVDGVTEVDEMFQNAGEKGIPHLDPEDPPRHRANKQRGHGTFDNDRPPIAGVVGRDSGEIRLEMVHHTNQETLEAVVGDNTAVGATVNTDEWSGYNGVGGMNRTHQTVCHSPTNREWARDDDGDGIREVHTNTMEGIWTGLRNFLRSFRGVSKHYLSQYVAIFQLQHNFKRVSNTVLRILLGAVIPGTAFAS